MALQYRASIMCGFFLIYLLFYPTRVNADPRILSITLKPQEQINWCWASTAQAMMNYFGKNVRQCDIANDALNRSDCCNSPNGPECNKGGTTEKVSEVIRDFAKIDTTIIKSPLSMDQFNTEISYRIRPFFVGWQWSALLGGGGHALLGYGIDISLNLVYYIDPDPDAGGKKVSLYGYFVGDWDHAWTETVVMKTDCSHLGMGLAPPYDKFDISDETELERRFLRISDVPGKDINGDGFFSFSDVVALSQCLLCKWNWESCK